MAETTVTQSDVLNLAKKLDELGDVLNATERAILLAIFKLASTAIASRVQGGGGGVESGQQTESGMSRVASRTAGAGGGFGSALPSLSAGFRSAFQPLGNADFTLRDKMGDVAGGVGIGVIW